MKGTFDAELRALERAHRASPEDPHVAHRYARALRRAGAGDEAVRVQFLSGERVAACAAVKIRWEVDDPVRTHALRPLAWSGRALKPEAIWDLVTEDLVCFDPARLAAGWPRRKDGALRLGRTCFLRSYKAHEPHAPHRRLVLVAWTPGTSVLYERPEDKGLELITVGLETRATRKKPLPEVQWRRRAAPA